MTLDRVSASIAKDIQASVEQVESAIKLLDEGATVPFIARYRKEWTRGLTDTQLRLLSERLAYLREFNDRKATILKTIEEQGKLTPELKESILAAQTKAHLEDLYLPFRPKRRTKAQLAKEAGLEPLALALWQSPEQSPLERAESFINPELGIDNAKVALEGAQHILMEHFSQDATLLEQLRQHIWNHGILKSKAAKNKKPSAAKFSDYFNYAEPIKRIPSHRALALFRGRRDSALQFELTLPDDKRWAEQRLQQHFNIQNPSSWLQSTLNATWTDKLWGKLELEAFNRLRELADVEAIRVFTNNLRDLLLAPPAGAHVTMGLDPGIRTGTKVVVINKQGQLLDCTTIFPLSPQNEWHESIARLAKLAAKHHVELIAIGNGTGSRETEQLVADLIKQYPDLSLTKILVNEAGASVYSASELAAQEFPDLDVTLRGAVSIARRLQDPLAELVKIEPKSIGVGQYQHDVNQPQLSRSLEGVVEDCVNAVGVDLNLASAALLSRVSGLNKTIANNLVKYREEHGVFQNREELKQVPQLGEKTFQQAAGFLRISNGKNPLDESGVHPECYPLIEKILRHYNTDLSNAIRNSEFLRQIDPAQHVTEQFGLPTVCDVLQELEKPGRDPRPGFKTVCFKEGIEDISQLTLGMELEGVVSNVTNFGAFVDIGVHQDGLVHISSMTDRFIKDPRSVVKTGDIVNVTVIEIDLSRRRIGLSMKPKKDTEVRVSRPSSEKKQKPIKKPNTANPVKKQPETRTKTPFNTSMADALAKLKTQ